MHTETILEAQAQIDHEIQALKDRIRQLLHSRNALAHVNQLPAELLVTIFKFYQRELVSRMRPEIVPWIYITHVCHRWRSLAFDSKALWTNIPINHSAYAQIASQLSDPLPVFVFGPRWSKANSLTAGKQIFFLSLLQRTRKVDVASHPLQFFMEKLVDAPTKTLPLIEEIKFTDLNKSVVKSPFPRTLKSLTLAQSSFEWSWFRGLNHLTELHLISVKVSVSVAAFVSYMLGIPRLSFLEISSFFCVSEAASASAAGTSEPEASYLDIAKPSSSHQRSRPTAFLSLTDLVLRRSSPAQPVTEFLSSINFDQEFTFTVDLPLNNPKEGYNFFSSIRHHLNASRHTIRHVVLDHSRDWGIDRATLSCFDHVSSATPFLCIKASFSAAVSRLWLDWIQALPLQNLELLSTNAFTNSKVWQNSDSQYRIRHLENLQELVLEDEKSSRAFLDYLATDADLTTRLDDWNSVAFPSLKKVTLKGLDSVTEGELAAFIGRAQHGHKLEEIILRDSPVDCEGITQLSTVIEKVTDLKIAAERTYRKW